MPDAELLRQLEQRLLETADCVPRCAEIAAANVSVDADTISMTLDMHATGGGSVYRCRARRRAGALRLFWSMARQCARFANGQWHVLVVRQTGPASSRPAWAGAGSRQPRDPVSDTPPRVITVASDGWLVAGVKDRRLLSGSLQLTRLQTDEGGDARSLGKQPLSGVRPHRTHGRAGPRLAGTRRQLLVLPRHRAR